MTDDTLKSLLADYAAPTEDQGFSDGVLASLRAHDSAQSVDLSRFARQPAPIWRGWLIALVIGLLCGLIWARIGVSVPDLPADAAILGALMTGWTAYGLTALALAACMLLIEIEAF